MFLGIKQEIDVHLLFVYDFCEDALGKRELEYHHYPGQIYLRQTLAISAGRQLVFATWYKEPFQKTFLLQMGRIWSRDNFILLEQTILQKGCKMKGFPSASILIPRYDLWYSLPNRKQNAFKFPRLSIYCIIHHGHRKKNQHTHPHPHCFLLKLQTVVLMNTCLSSLEASTSMLLFCGQ